MHTHNFSRSLILVFLVSSLQQTYAEEQILEEIIVTAERRAENLQNIPIAISAFDTETMDQLAIKDFYRVGNLAPGTHFSAFSLGQPQLFIRGIGSNEDGAGGDASVAVYLDGVYITRPSATTFNFFDLERIEVLRGPQGTLYGKNATGGAINVISAKPQAEFSSTTKLTLGNYDQKELDGQVNIPLTDNLWSRTAFIVKKRDGYVENTPTGSDLQDTDDIAGRLQFYYTSTENLDVLFSLDYEHIDRLGNARQITGPASAEALYSKDVHKSEADFDGFQKRDALGTKFELNWDLQDMGSLTSLTAYRKSDYDWLEDLDGLVATTSFFVTVNDTVNDQSEQFSQEFRIASPVGETVNWIAGIYYLHENASRHERFDLISLSGSPPPFSDPFNAFDQHNITDSSAVFGQMDYALTEKLNLTLGGRYTEERKEYTADASGVVGAFFITETYSIDTDKDWEAFSGKVALDYWQTDDRMFYANISRGFKSGGFQGQGDNKADTVKAFDPEYVTNYELGMKSEWLNQHLKLNLAAFYMDYTDLQVSWLEGTFRIRTENASDAVSQGVELEWDWLLSDDFRFFGAYTYNDTEYKNFQAEGGSNEDFTGNHLLYAPRHSGALNLQHYYPFQNGSNLRSTLTYTYTDERFADPFNYEPNKLDDQNLWDTRVSYEFPDGKNSLDFFVMNIFDEEYATHSFDFQRIYGFKTYGPPRTYGVTWQYTY